MIRIGLLGFGTVGSGVYRILNKHRESIKKKTGTELLIKRVLVSSKTKKREIELADELITDRAEEILNDPDIDLIVELIGGEEPAYSYIKTALENGKSVVTANKLVIARHEEEILDLAARKGSRINYEGSVAGGIPVIRPLQESFAANKIERIYGILNGTTNYILSGMTRDKKDFSEVLKEAQKLGYAERDPHSDISGEDAAYKIAILSSIAYDTLVDVDKIYVEGIESIELDDIVIADELGYVIKLLAIARTCKNGLDIRVHPAFISREHPLALVNDVYNAIYLNGDAVGDVMSYGRGAGQMPTASAVVADIMNVSRDLYYKRPDICSNNSRVNYKLVDINEVENSFYLRIHVRDKPGVLAKITRIFGDNNVSLASIIQKHRLAPVVPIVMITHQVREEYMSKSLAELQKINEVIEINNLIRVEEL